MKYILILAISLFVVVSCNSKNENEQTLEQEMLELRKKELELKERELKLKEKELAEQKSEEKDIREYSYVKYNGAWFDILYPSDFTPLPSIKSSSNIDNYKSVFFISPDKTVEFYIFSPQWSGEPNDIQLNPDMEKIKDKIEVKKDNF